LTAVSQLNSIWLSLPGPAEAGCNKPGVCKVSAADAFVVSGAVSVRVVAVVDTVVPVVAVVFV